jgi:hypothetical protein
MADVYGYILLPVKVRNYDAKNNEEVGERLRDVQFDHNGVEFWGEDMGFPVQFVEADTESGAIYALGERS